MAGEMTQTLYAKKNGSLWLMVSEVLGPGHLAPLL
jgi:hypothetical protein